MWLFHRYNYNFGLWLLLHDKIIISVVLYGLKKYILLIGIENNYNLYEYQMIIYVIIY